MRRVDQRGRGAGGDRPLGLLDGDLGALAGDAGDDRDLVADLVERGDDRDLLVWVRKVPSPACPSTDQAFDAVDAGQPRPEAPDRVEVDGFVAVEGGDGGGSESA